MGGLNKKHAILVLTIVLAYANTANSESNCNNAACPPYNGSSTIVQNPNECESFCVCTCDGAIYMPCPAGLHYNKECHMCDWPSHAGCDPSTPNTTVKPPPPNGCEKVKPHCPSTNQGNAILLPNPDDCGSYCVCDWGTSIWMPCPEGLDFNPVLKVCESPDHAGCRPTPKPTAGPDPGTTTTKRPDPTGNCSIVAPLCPPTNEGKATLLPNPGDCGSYCVCDWGKPIWMPCPDGLDFNPVLKVCDSPDHAGCRPTPKPTAGPDPGTTTTKRPDPTGNCSIVAPLCPPTNEGNAILLPNPGDCTSYCVCDWGKPIWMPCPDGLDFNPVLKVCDSPDHAGCRPTPKPTAGPDPGTTTTKRPDPTGNCSIVAPLCPPTNEGNAILLPNPGDCSSYCVCDWGKPIWMPCPDGLDFNPVLKVCDSPDNAGCRPTPKPTAGPVPGTTTTKRPDPTGNCSIVAPLCPPTNEGNAILLPNPGDCSSYCVCDWGKPIWMPCPDGLDFNPVLKVCDSPDHAGCRPTPKPTAGPDPGTTTTKRPDPTGNCSIVAPLCPPTNEGNVILLPNPGDCSSYCECDWGEPIWMPCPDGLDFNPVLKVCDWPDHAGCRPTPNPTAGPDPGTTTTKRPDPTGNCSIVASLCPPTNEGNAILLPNPGDCSSYCVCDWGKPIWMPCPDGLDFNPVLKVCDWPDHAGCRPTPKPTGGPDPGTTTTRKPTGDCSKVEPLCPPTNGVNATLLPNPDDCGSYCVCDWGKPIWMPCPDGLDFNPVLKVCDWPDHAGCRPTPKPTGGPDPGTTTTRKPTGDCSKVEPLCPPTNGVNATLLPNPDDCGSYCVCDWGKPILMPCPDGLYFNPTLKVCDWPENSGCGVDPTHPPPPPVTSTTKVTYPTTKVTYPTTKPPPPPTQPDITTTTTTTTTARPTPTATTPTGTTHGIDGCFLVVHKCPVPENPDHATLFANPWDVRSYCKCDWGKIHWMPCDPGTTFREDLQVCI